MGWTGACGRANWECEAEFQKEGGRDGVWLRGELMSFSLYSQIATK